MKISRETQGKKQSFSNQKIAAQGKFPLRMAESGSCNEFESIDNSEKKRRLCSTEGLNQST